MIQIGDVYRIKMYHDDGIKPKGTDIYREKYIIIIGHDGINLYGAVATNTRDHHLVPITFQYPLNLSGYPAEEKIYSSIRLAAMRDGIADYELLKLLEQKSPDKAKELAGAIIIDFNSYNNDIQAFRLIRLKLLKLLSE